jgi:alpha-mannosidase
VFAPEAFNGATLPESFSFFDIDNENIMITAIKKCEDDESLIIRLYNIGDQTETLNLSTKYASKEIIKVNLIEEEIEKVDKIELGKYAVETFKLKYR